MVTKSDVYEVTPTGDVVNLGCRLNVLAPNRYLSVSFPGIVGAGNSVELLLRLKKQR